MFTLTRKATFSLFLSKSLSRLMATKSSTQSNIEGDVYHSFLDLERLDPNIFKAPTKYLWRPTNSRFIFGGQVVGQALVAACNTVSAEHHVHSLHCYFLRGGNSNWPILYHVDRTRDGETYASRSVKATQEGKAIFTMQASFKTVEPLGYSFQMEMPKVKGPEHFINSDEVLRIRLQDEDISDREREFLSRMISDDIPVLIRPLDPSRFYRLIPGEPTRMQWMKADGFIGDDNKLHQCVAAYMSDFSLLGTALQPGGNKYEIKFMTSLDHTIWFHNQFRADEWMLYESFSPTCGYGKALVTGRVWKTDGTLAMSVSQEGVVRTEPIHKL